MSTLPNSAAQVARRRSKRISLNTSIGVSGTDGAMCPFTMPATATNLNRHGAAIHLARGLTVGSTITVRNARGTQVPARVVAQLVASQTVSAYAIEFLTQDDAALGFWGITFPALASRAAVAEQDSMARRRRTISPLAPNRVVLSQPRAAVKP